MEDAAMENVSYEYVNESEIAANLKCDHCAYPLIDPMVASCKHKFCAKCIRSASGNQESCPGCSEAVESWAQIMDPMVINQLKGLLVNCGVCDKRNIPREYVDEHLENHRLKEICGLRGKPISELENQLSKLKLKNTAIQRKFMTMVRGNSLDPHSLANRLRVFDSRGIAGKYIDELRANYSERYAFVAEDPYRERQGVDVYYHLPAVSLEEAIQPLDSLVPHVQRMAWTVKGKCETLTDPLSCDEAASIMLYSMEVEPSKNCFYRLLNGTLQHEDVQAVQPWGPYLRLLTMSLDKLPSVKDQCMYRAVGADVSHQYPVGSEFTWYEFSLCTPSRENLKRFLDASKATTIFQIESCSGKDIRRYSCFQKDGEVLLPAGKRFKVITHNQESPELRIIHIQEFPPSRAENLRLDRRITECLGSSKMDLSGLELLDQDMRSVAEKVINNGTCLELDLGDNKLTSEGARIIGDAMCSNSIMKRLYLSGNRIADEGAYHLAHTINRSRLFVLGLSDNGITDRGAQYLGEMLKGKERLRVLGLEGNDMSDQGVELLVDGLRENTNRQRLLMAKNKKIIGSCVKAIIGMLQHNKSLLRLNLEDCSLSEEAKYELRKAVETKTGFQLWL